MPGEQRSLKEVFLAALAIAPAERAAWLENACGSNAELRRHVELMLAAHDEPQSLIDRMAPAGGPHEAATGPVALGPDRRAEPMETETAGTMIGPYKLLEQIGEGGMGTVWMAEQTAPIHRRVAIKVVKEGMDSKQVLARFEAERQALALMDHPNIARVFEAGFVGVPALAGASQGDAEDRLKPGLQQVGRPYFVMELVKGLPITRYCDERRLGVRERLELFADVCRAVQHAHQKGIIHRDIKPSNVLVAPYDGRPVVKVIDFGVAKATGQRLTDKTLFTGFGAVVGTLEYMSPEQAELNNQDIDTRSDVYSLGVLLYELLTGTTPLSRERLKEAAMLEVLRLIREEEPLRPSTRLSTTEELPTVAANRGIEPKKLSGLVRGELDWIVMKALEKDRNRRYETANGLAMDVQRFLADETVLACPPSAWYRLRKVVRRNKGPVAAVSVFVLLLVIGVIGLAIGLVAVEQARRQTTRERDQKEQALDAETKARESEKHSRTLAMNALRHLTDNVVEQQLARRMALTDNDRRFLRGIQRQYEEFAALPGDDAEQRSIRAEGHLLVGYVRFGLGEEKEAETSYRIALGLYRGLAADFPNQPEFRHKLARSQNQLGVLLESTGRLQEAETAFTDALALRRQLAEEFHADPTFRQELAAGLYNRAILLQRTGRLKGAATAYTEAGALQRKLSDQFPTRAAFRRELALSKFNLALVLQTTGRLREAEAVYGEARAVQKQLNVDFPTRPEFRQDLATSNHNLGLLLQITGRLKEAEYMYNGAMELWRQLATDFPIRPEYRQELARSQSNLGVLFQATGRVKEAEVAYADSLALRKRITAEFPGRPEFRHELAECHLNLGLLFQVTGRPKEAEAAYTEGLALWRRLVADFPTRPEFLQRLAHTHNNLGALYFTLNRLKEAEKAYADALPLMKQLTAASPKVPDYQHKLAGTLGNLALVANERRDFRAARRWLDQALPHHKAALQANPREPSYQQSFRNYLFTLVKSCAGTGDPTEALRAAEKLRDLTWDPPATAYDAACALALSARIVAQNDQVTDDAREKQSRPYADHAMATLRIAIARGFKNADHLKKDPDLEPLRARADFKKLLAELEAKSKA